MWLMPTRGRPSNLRRFLNAAREMGTSSAGLILVNESEWAVSQAEYDELKPLMPTGWSYLPVKAECYGEAIRAVWDQVKDRPWIGLVSDDLVPCTSGWDKALISSLNGWNVVSSNDGWQAPNRMHGAIVWSGDLARAIGWVFPDGLRHIFHDDVWETLGRETGCWQVRMDVMCKHLHESLDGTIGPTMDPTSDLWKHDQAWFEDWRTNEKDNCIQRIRDLMGRKGVRIMKPDYAGVQVMLGTPCATGRYESAYVVSLFQTMRMLQENGVACHWAEEKYTADIALARAKVFAAFLRSTCTHLLMVDDDMGWTNDAVNRLFCAKADFVAVAGPKKRYPIQFAANHTDDKGNPINLVYDDETGTMEVSEIGAAFCLITRDCAERVVRAFPELSYTGVTGEQEWALFNPMVRGGRFYSEDFSFCARLRTIGVKVRMVPDVPLTHTGMHTFSGAFSETYTKPEQLLEAAE